MFGTSPQDKQMKHATRPLNCLTLSPAMVDGEASSSGKRTKRKAIGPNVAAGKKQKTVAQVGSPEWPSYFHDVRSLSTLGNLATY